MMIESYFFKKCLICGHKFKTWPYKERNGIGKYCSNKCKAESFKKYKVKIYKDIKGEKSSSWKGDNAGYRAIHIWVNKNKGKATKCEHCNKEGTGREIQWANIDHLYKRDTDDYISLCYKCHGKYDKNNGLRKH